MSALNHLHNNLRIMHRDIKINNILFSDDSNKNQIKLIDFGFATSFTPGGPNETEQLGTPCSIPPEMIKGKYNEKCDIWSLGILMMEMVTLKKPFDDTSIDNVFNKILN